MALTGEAARKEISDATAAGERQGFVRGERAGRTEARAELMPLLRRSREVLTRAMGRYSIQDAGPLLKDLETEIGRGL